MLANVLFPRIIHYCWFGKAPKPLIVRQCLETWKKHNPDFQIIEWNEGNSPKHPIVTKNLDQKLWAFASDYVRLFALYNYGGIYLDTDMLLVKPLLPLMQYPCFTAFQYKIKNEYWINNSAMGGIKGHSFFNECIIELERLGHTKLKPYISPKLTTTILTRKNNNIIYGTQTIDDITILDVDYFYYYERKDMQIAMDQLIQQLPEKAIGFHLFEGSWLKEAQNKNTLEKVTSLVLKIRKKMFLMYLAIYKKS